MGTMQGINKIPFLLGMKQTSLPESKGIEKTEKSKHWGSKKKTNVPQKKKKQSRTNKKKKKKTKKRG